MKMLATIVGIVLCVPAFVARADEVSRHITFDGPPERVWAVLEDVCSITDWYRTVSNCEILEEDGETFRRITLDEGIFLEQIIDHDPNEMRYSYAIVEGAPQVRDYVATIEVNPSDEGAIVTWSSRFEPVAVTSEEAVAFLGRIYEKDLARLVALARDGRVPAE